jgi:DNA gyrase/topoisomerase IV subunit A
MEKNTVSSKNVHNADNSTENQSSSNRLSSGSNLHKIHLPLDTTVTLKCEKKSLPPIKIISHQQLVPPIKTEVNPSVIQPYIQAIPKQQQHHEQNHILQQQQKPTTTLNMLEIEKQLIELRKQTEDLRKQLEMTQQQNEDYRIRLEKVEKELESYRDDDISVEDLPNNMLK